MQKRSAGAGSPRLGTWAIILFVLGLMLSHYPFIHLFNRPLAIMGIPLLIAYFHGIWILAIVSLVVLGHRWARAMEKDTEAREP